MLEIPTEAETKTQQLIAQMGWTTRATSSDNVAVETCPICGHTDYKFFIHVGGDKDGLWDCKVCGQKGNYFQLRERLGIRMAGAASAREMAPSAPAPLPNIEVLHKWLVDGATDNADEVLRYLTKVRGFSLDTLKKLKIGAEQYDGRLWVVYPYMDAAGKCVYYKARTVPPEKKFRAPAGREAMLYNDVALRPGLDELVMVEGEADCIALLNQGYEATVGIPGAGIKKAAWLEKLDRVAPKTIYLCYDTDKVGQDAARDMAARIGLDRVKNLVLPAFETVGQDGKPKPGKDINEWFVSGRSLGEFQALKADAKPFDVEGVQCVGDVLDELITQLEEKGCEPTYLTPWPSLTKRLGGAEDGDVIGIIAEGKTGKMQPLSAKVLTPTGWTRIGDLSVGDALASTDGQRSEVQCVVDHGLKQLFRVTFSDGRKTRCGAEHLWRVGCVGNFSRDGYRVVDTAQLSKLLEGNEEWFVPLFCGEWGVEESLPLRPWLLGALLGDGGLSQAGVRFTKTDPIVVQTVRSMLRTHLCELHSLKNGKDYRVVGSVYRVNHVLDALRKLGLHGSKSVDKHIPDPYMTASRHLRLDLLRGLMDTGGTADGKYGVPIFSTSSLTLAFGVVDLVRSLGGVAEVKPRGTPHYAYKGEKRVGADAYRVLVKLNDACFLFSEKAPKEVQRSRQFRLKVVSIEASGVEEARCIKVSHPSQLYITDDYIVTHNTTVGLDWCQWAAERGTGSMLYCLEMLPTRLVRKWVSHVTQTDDTPGSSQITPDVVRTAKILGSQMPADLLFGYSKSRKPDDVCETVRQAVRRYGTKLVCLDNLQLLIHGIKETAQETSKVMKQIKALAMELRILMLLIIQPNRVGEGQIVAARNALGSSAIEKDVDAMICLHRNRVAQIKASDFHGFLEAEDNFEPAMLTRVDLSRYSAGGTCTLMMDGARSTIREPTSDDVKGIVTTFPQGIQVEV